MKLSPISNFNFKGYLAGKIKALYMQNPGNDAMVNIYNQMRSIGQSEGFDVFIHDEYDLKNEPLQDWSRKRNPWGVWAQDNKIITKIDGEDALVISDIYDEDEQQEAEILSSITKMPLFTTDSYIEGGNVFLGKKPDGSNFMITSYKTLLYNGVLEYLKTKNLPELTHHRFIHFIEYGEYIDRYNPKRVSTEEFLENEKAWVDKAKNIFLEDYDIKEENLIILPPPEYHIDLAIRPLEYPYVLVSDDVEVEKYLSYLEKYFSDDSDSIYELQKIKQSVDNSLKVYHEGSFVAEQLASFGFVPIKIAGNFGRGPVNFMNAIVQKTDDGLVYITNGTKPSTPLYEKMQDDFEAELLKKCPQIKKVYFVDGGSYDDETTNIMRCLRDYRGGIHCMVCEEMEE